MSSMITFLPPPGEISLSRLMEDVLACLRRQPMVPLDLRVLTGNLSGVTLADVERAIEKLEGPIVNGSASGAYLHLCRINNQAVYIP